MGKSTNPRQRDAAFDIRPRGASGKPVRPSQTERENANAAVAIDTRRRLFGLTRDQAKNPMAGYAIGILCLAGVLTREEHDAVYGYAATDSRWRALKGLPRQSIPAICLNGAPSGRSLKPQAVDEELLAEITLRRESQRARLQHGIGLHGLSMFDTQVLRDEPLASPLATLALVNGAKILSAGKGG